MPPATPCAGLLTRKPGESFAPRGKGREWRGRVKPSPITPTGRRWMEFPCRPKKPELITANRRLPSMSRKWNLIPLSTRRFLKSRRRRRPKPIPRRLLCKAGRRLFTQNLNQHPLAALPVEFRVIDLLPGAEVKLSVGYRNQHLMAHQ